MKLLCSTTVKYARFISIALLFLAISITGFVSNPLSTSSTFSSFSSPTTSLNMAAAPKLSEGPWKKFMIQRSIPGAGKMTAAELVKAGCGSNKINEDQGCKCVCWINSFVVGEGTFCIYAAAKEEDVKCHAECLTPDAPFTITEIVGTLDVTGAYLRQDKCD